MKRVLLLCAVLLAPRLFAGTCSAAIAEVVPQSPTQHQEVELRIAGDCPDNCVPGEPRVYVSERTIRIDFDVQSCALTVITPWAERIQLGSLLAGTYDVEVRMNGTTVLRQPLEIREVLFRVSPRVVAPGGTFVIDLVDGSEWSGPNAPPQGGVTLNGERAALVVGRMDGGYTVTLPSTMAPGPLTVGLRRAGGAPDATDVIRVATALSPEDATRVLVPLVYKGPGAHGSQWEATTRMHSFAGRETMVQIGRHAVRLPVSGTALLPNEPRDGGMLISVPRGLESDYRYESRFADASRATTGLGTEIRLVPERDMASRVRITGVPVDARYRTTLRVYDIDANVSDVLVTLQGNGTRRTVSVPLVEGSGCREAGCFLESPGFGVVDLSSIDGLAGAEPFDLTIQASTNDRRLWAFVSVTNNETQHVTLVSPQPEVRR